MEVVEFACGIPQLLKGEITEQVGRGIDAWSVRQPLGVVAGITPFNFPVMVPMWMWPVALACGNTFILKPSERDPSPSLEVARLLTEAGCPDGVFNVVNGSRAAVEALLQHPDVAAVSFVGSTPVAEAVHRTGTAAGKRVQALGGAKNHLVVMPDADLDLTTEALLGSAYGSAGERCMAISVAVAVGDVAGRARRTARAAGARTPRRPGDGPGGGDGPARHPGASGPRARRTSTSARRRARRWSSTDGASVWPARRMASISADASSTGCVPRCASTARRSSARCWRWCGCEPSTRRWPWWTPTPTATGLPSSPDPARRRGSSPPASTAGWWASTCPSRCRWPSTASAAGSARSSATTRCTAPRASASTPA